jgi:hypothetical protein
VSLHGLRAQSANRRKRPAKSFDWIIAVPISLAAKSNGVDQLSVPSGEPPTRPLSEADKAAA